MAEATVAAILEVVALLEELMEVVRVVVRVVDEQVMAVAPKEEDMRVVVMTVAILETEGREEARAEGMVGGEVVMVVGMLSA